MTNSVDYDETACYVSFGSRPFSKVYVLVCMVERENFSSGCEACCIFISFFKNRLHQTESVISFFMRSVFLKDLQIMSI